jgi:hypothetical protein
MLVQRTAVFVPEGKPGMREAGSPAVENVLMGEEWLWEREIMIWCAGLDARRVSSARRRGVVCALFMSENSGVLLGVESEWIFMDVFLLSPREAFAGARFDDLY